MPEQILVFLEMQKRMLKTQTVSHLNQYAVSVSRLVGRTIPSPLALLIDRPRCQPLEGGQALSCQQTMAGLILLLISLLYAVS